jgi:hypothetical protein
VRHTPPIAMVFPDADSDLDTSACASLKERADAIKIGAGLGVGFKTSWGLFCLFHAYDHLRGGEACHFAKLKVAVRWE